MAKHKDKNDPVHLNHLANEKSPYLLQHATNPVDWYPWGDEAFDLARREDKPIFLSIGYSTCHWCHVMEHESFEKEDVAALLNDTFVCIKVDREERPDIDNVYMTVCQMMTGGGGWPMTIIMTPDHEPFFAATYIPKAGLMQLARRVKTLWSGDQRQQLIAHAGEITAALNKATNQSSGANLGLAQLKSAYSQLAARYDSANGGFGSQPKFPTAHNLTFLLRWWSRTHDDHALKMVENTLDHMRRGGMYDQVGFGFCRYSTDSHWFVPHFEKMAYDQALLALAYTEAWQATGKEEYRRTAEEILTYVLRDMTSPDGGFYTAEDADSDGKEGLFYLWSADELRKVLGDDADLAMRVYGATEKGNYHEEASGRAAGTNILFLPQPLDDVAKAEGMPRADLDKKLESIRTRLFAVREKRVHPQKDDKVLTDINGLMMAAFARAGRVFGDDRYTDAARAAVRFIDQKMKSPDGGLFHRYRDGSAAITSMVDDYAFQAWGRLELYETTFDPADLDAAIDYASYLRDHFWDTASGGLYFTADGSESLIAREKKAYDGAVPSGNSVAMLVFIEIARITGVPKWENDANAIGAAFATQVSRAPVAFTQMMSAVDFVVGPTFEVVIAGEPGTPGTRRMLHALRSRYIPRKVVLLRTSSNADRVAALAPFTRLQSEMNGNTTAYVCRNHACDLPTTDPSEMERLLGLRQ